MNIYQKLVEVRKVVPYIQKADQGAQYSYTGSSRVLAAVKSKMDELGLLLIPSVTGHKLSESPIEFKDANGNVTKRTTTYFTELEMTMTWVNAEKPDEQIVSGWYGQGVDIAGEKGVGKALTYAEKYFMLKFFNIATDKDDLDAFQDKVGQIKVDSNAIAQLKTEWLGAGYNIKQLNQRVKEVYSCGVSELKEEQADELLTKLREKKAGKSA